MKTTAGILAMAFVGVGLLVTPSFAEDAAPQTLTEAEQAEVKKMIEVASCIQDKAMMFSLTSMFASPEEQLSEAEMEQKVVQIKADCGEEVGYTMEQAKTFEQGLIKKYGGVEATQDVVNNTFSSMQP